MLDFAEGHSFQSYLEKGYEEERERQLRAMESTETYPGFENAVRRVRHPLRIAAFAEIYCPDSVVTMPFVKKMEELNPLIAVSIFPKEQYEKILEEYTGTVRIPTLLFFDGDMHLRGSYVEMPKALKTAMKDADAPCLKSLVLAYRQGKYNHLVQDELISILLAFTVE